VRGVPQLLTDSVVHCQLLKLVLVREMEKVKKEVMCAILAMILAGTLWTAVCVQVEQPSGTDSSPNDPLVKATSLMMNSEPSNGLYETSGSAARENQVRMECGTITLLETRVCQENAALGMRSKSDSSFTRPTDPNGGYDGKQHTLPQLYGTTNFMFHWTNGTDGGTALDAVNKTDSNENGIPDHVENFGVIFEEVRDFLLNVKGFKAPPADTAEPNDQNNRNPDGRYDVFFYAFNAGGYAQWEAIDSPSPSYIGMRSDYTGWADPWNTKYGVMQAIAAHEFFHAIEFVYDVSEGLLWMEMTATYMEDEVYPDVNRNYYFLWDWFETCDVNGLLSTDGDHEYGDFIFLKRLSEDFGDGIIKEIWEEFGKPNVRGLTAIRNVLQTKNTTLWDEFSRFIMANFFLEEMYAAGTDYRRILEGKPPSMESGSNINTTRLPPRTVLESMKRTQEVRAQTGGPGWTNGGPPISR